jgi:hypothetical protein
VSEIFIDEARQIAVQCWCREDTSHIIMIPELCEAFARTIVNWMDTAAFHARNEEYFSKQTLQQQSHLTQLARAVIEAHRFRIDSDRKTYLMPPSDCQCPDCVLAREYWETN